MLLLTAMAANARKLKRAVRKIRGELMRIPWNAKQLACDRCSATEPVPPDLLFRIRLRTCRNCLSALYR
jgi:hypothetical protein